MEVKVNGRRMEVPEKLRGLTEDKLERIGRIVEMQRAEVLFTQANSTRILDQVECEVTLEGHGHHVRAKVAAPDGFTAVDKAATKIDAQVHKLKTKLRRHGVETIRDQPDAAFEQATDDRPEAPRIVKSKRFAMMPMTPEDAVSRMELLGHGFFFFTSADTGRAAVIYRRDDGDVGLIDEAD